MLEKFKQIVSFCAGNFENFLCWHSFVLDWTRIFGHCAGLDWTGVFEILGNTAQWFKLKKMLKRWHENAMVTWILLLSAFCLGTPEQICKGDAWNLHENGVGIYLKDFSLNHFSYRY